MSQKTHPMIQQRQLAAQWIEQAAEDDIELPDDPDIEQAIVDELRRQWEQLKREYSRAVTSLLKS